MPDPIKKTTSYDPSTGETTFKASWSNSGNGISRGPITPKTTQRTVAARQVSNPASKVVATRSESAGQRMAIAFKSPTPAGTTGMELKGNNDISKKAPIKTESSEDFRKRNLRFNNDLRRKEDEESLLKSYPGKTLEQAYKQREKNKEAAIRKSNRSVKDEGGFFSNDKQKSGACRTC